MGRHVNQMRVFPGASLTAISEETQFPDFENFEIQSVEISPYFDDPEP